MRGAHRHVKVTDMATAAFDYLPHTHIAPATAALAREVGEHYLEANSMPSAAPVVAAYRQLQAETDRLLRQVLKRTSPAAVRVVFTWCREPYVSDRELIDSVRATRVLEVTTAAIESEPLHPVLDCGYGEAFDRFRALHDLIGHVRTGLGFGLADELAVWRSQDRMHGALARRALATELLAVNGARSVLGRAPELKAMLLDPTLVCRARASIPLRDDAPSSLAGIGFTTSRKVMSGRRSIRNL